MQREKWGLDFIDKDVKVHCAIDFATGKQKEHSHDFMEIEYISNGRCVQTINGERYECDEGDFCFFYIGDRHSYEPIGIQAEITNLVFDPILFNSMMLHRFFPIDKRINSVIKLPEKEKERAVKLIEIIRAEYNNAKEGYIYVMQNLLQSLVCILLRYGKRKKEFDERVSKILELIEKDYSITTDEIANTCGFCKNHIFRIFKESMGITIKEYINQKRVYKAYTLIKTTDMSIENIMEQIGLNNRTYFYNLFKNQIGKTPGQLRKIDEEIIDED